MQEVALAWAIVATILGVAAFRGLLDLIFHRFIPWPSLFGIDNAELREEDVVARRRVWFWRWWAKIAWFILLIIFAIYAVRVLKYGSPTRASSTRRRTLGTGWPRRRT